MIAGVNLPAIYVADMAGIVIMFMLLFGNRWDSHFKNRENKSIFCIIACLIFLLIVEIISFYYDGKVGEVNRFIVYFSNWLLFAVGLIIGILWIWIITKHIEGGITKRRKIILACIVGFGISMLIVNLFEPIIFEVDDKSVYARKPFYMLFSMVDIILLLYAIIIYIVGLLKGGVLKFFPVFQFVCPIILGGFAQVYFYGIATVWLGVSVGVCGLLFGLQNENIYIDKLTGVYNRYYIDCLKEYYIKNKKAVLFSAIMLNIDGFRKFNEKYGHVQGDKLLIDISNILNKLVMNNGSIIRYFGDEFIVLLNTDQVEVLKEYIDNISESLKLYNQKHYNENTLTVSFGYGVFNFKEQSIDTILKILDEQIYDNKEKIYKNGNSNALEI